MSILVWWVKLCIAASAVWGLATWLYSKLRSRGWF